MSMRQMICDDRNKLEIWWQIAEIKLSTFSNFFCSSLISLDILPCVLFYFCLSLNFKLVFVLSRLCAINCSSFFTWPRWFDIDCAINLICVTNVSFTQNLQLQRKKTFKETFCFILLLHSFSFYCQIPSFLEKLRTQLFNLQLEPCQGQYKFNFTVF